MSEALGTPVSLIKTGGTMSYYLYLGPLGEVVRDEASFIASKDGFLIGTYDRFGEAMEALAWKGRERHADRDEPYYAQIL